MRKGNRAKVLVCLACGCLCLALAGKSVKKEKTLGQVLTPAYLVEDILDIVGYSSGDAILGRHVIDNSCGEGAFLTEIVRRYGRAFLRRSDDRDLLARQLREFVHGIEIDAAAHRVCLQRLDGVAMELGVGHVRWDVRLADTLGVDAYDGKMDFVVGNPPYVRVHNLAENFNRVKGFAFATGGMTDLYLVFYEIGLRMLAETGKLCYIAPSSWINSMAGRSMRTYLREHGCLVGVVDLGHYQPFNATAYTAIVTLCKGGNGPTFRYGVYDGPHDYHSVGEIAYDTAFFSDALFLGTADALARHRALMEARVPTVVQVKNGFATLADSVFIADDFPFEAHVIPVLKASTGKWRKAFYPYDAEGRPLAREEVFAGKRIADYLEAHRETLLKGRRESDKPDWYLYGRTQALKDVSCDKYAINTCIRDVTSIKFNKVPAGTGVYSGLYILTSVPEQTLREVILDERFIAYIAMLKKYKSGGYYTFSSHDLAQYLNVALSRRKSHAKKRTSTTKKKEKNHDQ